MQYRSIKGYSGWGQLGILLIFLGLGFILVGAIQFLIGLQVIPAGVPVNKMGEAMVKALSMPEHVNLARLAQVLSSFALFFVPVVLYQIVCYGKDPFWLGFNKHINAWQILVGFFIIFFANVVAGPLADISKNLLAHFPQINNMAQSLEQAYNDQVSSISNLTSWPEFFLSVIIMAFIPAMFEEIFFRGALQNLLERWWKAPLLAIIVSSILFSLIHMSFYLFISRAVLGFVLGFMYQRSRNLWVNIIAHFLNNLIALIQMFWISRHNGKIELDKLDPKIPLLTGLVALMITFGLFYFFNKVSLTNRNMVAFEEQNMIDKADPNHFFSSSKNN